MKRPAEFCANYDNENGRTCFELGIPLCVTCATLERMIKEFNAVDVDCC